MRQRHRVWARRRLGRQRPYGPQPTVRQIRRRKGYQHRWTEAYCLHVGDGQAPDAWARFLREITSRPGWSVARLARESGIHRGTIFAWIKEGGATINVASVRLVAKAAQVDMATAMLAAGDVLGPPALDNDPEMRTIVESDLSPERKAWFVAHVRARRARELEATKAMLEQLTGEG